MLDCFLVMGGRVAAWFACVRCSASWHMLPKSFVLAGLFSFVGWRFVFLVLYVNVLSASQNHKKLIILENA